MSIPAAETYRWRRDVYEDCIVQCQLPLAIADDSEPEPDVAVVEGEIADYRARRSR